MSTMMSSSSTAVAKSQAQVIAVVFSRCANRGRAAGGRAAGGCAAGGCRLPLCLSPLPNRNR